MKMEPGFVTSLKQELDRFGNIRDRLNADGGLTDKQLIQLVSQSDQESEIIEVIDDCDVITDSTLSSDIEGVAALLQKEVAVVVLAGGLATRMGSTGALTQFSNGMSLLTFKLTQLGRAPTILMINPSMKDNIVDHVNSLTTTTNISAFEQFESFSLTPDNRLKLDQSGNPTLYPTGTGDLASAMEKSEIVDALQEVGIKHVIVTDVNNLGLPINTKALTHHLKSRAPVTCQVVRRRLTDENAIVWVNGNKQVLDLFRLRLPDDFNVAGPRWTSTNTFIVNLDALKKAATIPSRYHRVRKIVNGSLSVQYERFVHELTAFFPTEFVEVDRELYYDPVKTTRDLEKAQDTYFSPETQ
jgi:UTP--glucose-1-phosphate uridylyltransferase